MTAGSGRPWADVAQSSLLLTIGPKGAGNMVSPAIRLTIGVFHKTHLNHYRALMPDGKEEFDQWVPVIAAARLNEGIEPERQALIEDLREAFHG